MKIGFPLEIAYLRDTRDECVDYTLIQLAYFAPGSQSVGLILPQIISTESEKKE